MSEPESNSPSYPLVLRTDAHGRSVAERYNVLRFFLGGSAIGLVVWAAWSRELSVLSIGGHVIGFAVLMAVFALIPAFRYGDLLEAIVDEATITFRWPKTEIILHWQDITAINFDHIPIQGSDHSHVIRFLTRQKQHDIIVDGLSESDLRLLAGAVNDRAAAYDITDDGSESMSTFRGTLAKAGAWCFLLPGPIMLGLSLVHLYTFPLILGLSIMATGWIIACMTWRERISRLVIGLGIVALIGSIAIIKVTDLSVRQTMLEWEALERKHWPGMWPEREDDYDPAAGESLYHHDAPELPAANTDSRSPEPEQ